MNEMILAQDFQNQQFPDHQKAVRYLDNEVVSKNALRSVLENAVKKFKSAGGEIHDIPGFEGIKRREHSVSERDHDYAGFVKVARVIRWVNADVKHERRKKLFEHTGIPKGRLYSITSSCTPDRGVMKNGEYKKIIAAMPLIEAQEKEVVA